MKHIFSAFPAGAAGIALLLLRGSAALLLIAITRDACGLDDWLAGGLYVVAAAIGLGLFTRAAAGLCGTIGTLVLLRCTDAPFLLVVTHALDAAALTLLGSGAYSLDARLFGRRVIRIGSRRSSPIE